MATYQYCVASNWGKGFITAEDSRKLQTRGFPGNVWRVPANNQDANRWIAGVAGERKTLSEAILYTFWTSSNIALWVAGNYFILLGRVTLSNCT